LGGHERDKSALVSEITTTWLAFKNNVRLQSTTGNMKLQKASHIGMQFAQTYACAGTGEHAWFADVDRKSHLGDESDSTDTGNRSPPSYCARLFHMSVRLIVNKVRILKYRMKHQMVFYSNSSKPAKQNSTIKWAETDLKRQEQEAQERHGVREFTEYQVAQRRIRILKLRKEYLRKKNKRQASVAEYISD
jgi:hypothetical protein